MSSNDQKVKSLQAFAIAQTEKNQEIIDSIRAHHGKLIGDNVTLLVNMMMHQQQLETLVLTFIKAHTALIDRMEDSSIADALKLGLLVDRATSHLERGNEIPIAVFSCLFNAEERELLIPFLNQIRNNIGDITKNILAATEQ